MTEDSLVLATDPQVLATFSAELATLTGKLATDVEELATPINEVATAITAKSRRIPVTASLSASFSLGPPASCRLFAGKGLCLSVYGLLKRPACLTLAPSFRDQMMNAQLIRSLELR